MGMIDEEKYKDIPRNTWPDLIKLGAEAIKNKQTKSGAENRTGEAEKVKENGSDKSKDTTVQIINTHNTYGEQVKAGQWGYRPSKNNTVGRDPYDKYNKRYAVGDLTLEGELNESFRSFTNSDKRVIRGLAETNNRRDMEPIFTSEVTLLTDALCKGVTNLSSITRKRDPSTFRTQLTTIISLLRREFDRANFPATYFTTTEDIIATLSMVEKQLWGLTHKVKMKDVEQTEEAQLKQLKDSLKRIKTKLKDIKKELKKCYKSRSSTSDEEEYEVEGGEGTQVPPSESSPVSKNTRETKSQENE